MVFNFWPIPQQDARQFHGRLRELGVTANLKVTDIDESLLVHPALAEALAEAAE